MFKKLSYSLAVFCMICSAIIPSLNAECPCKKKKRGAQEVTVVTPDQTPKNQNEVAN